jgi:hypothetical protein
MVGSTARDAEGVPVVVAFGDTESDVLVEMGECGVRVSVTMLGAGVVSGALTSPAAARGD